MPCLFSLAVLWFWLKIRILIFWSPPFSLSTVKWERKHQEQYLPCMFWDGWCSPSIAWFWGIPSIMNYKWSRGYVARNDHVKNRQFARSTYYVCVPKAIRPYNGESWTHYGGKTLLSQQFVRTCICFSLQVINHRLKCCIDLKMKSCIHISMFW